ncbi:MAG TPA: sugar transferase [Propionicimonas sp.]|jgi:exopolysaccharide biosynthesis polyprenyl glycosylphosphotransferase|uniref:sugar transferase n=1 Tax=Propionicimonas sp. TaxID=1955623 RepID=UPI002F3FFA09
MTTLSSYLDTLTTHAATNRNIGQNRLVGRTTQRFLLFGADALIIAAALLVGVFARGFVPLDGGAVGLPAIATVAVGALWLTALMGFGTYQLRHLRAGTTEYKRVLMASFIVAGATAIVSYLAKAEFPRGLYVLSFGLGTIGLVASRFVRRKSMAAIHRQGALMTPIVVAGDSGHVDEIAKVLRRETWLGYKVVGAVTRYRGETTPNGLPILGQVTDTVDVIKNHDIATVIFAEGSFQSPADFRRMAWELEEHEIHMIVVPALTDISAQRLDVRPVAGLPLVDVARPQAIAAARWIKRTWDAAGAAVLLLLASPVMALVALAIKIEDGGPVLFRQTRVGLRGEVFQCLKFRSMVLDAEARLAELAAANEGSGPLFKMTQDPRITNVGRFIRRFSLDELPQLWNALRGDMSLVGPRPALPSEVAQYDSDTRRRLDVRPGLTGLWQVSGRSNLSWDDTVRLDLYYVDNWSLIQDVQILFRTARAIVGSSGAY